MGTSELRTQDTCSASNKGVLEAVLAVLAIIAA
jgi:hypothetical protein